MIKKDWHGCQVYRALRPSASGDACVSLLSCLHKCLLSPAPTSLHTAVEVCFTLQVGAKVCPWVLDWLT